MSLTGQRTRGRSGGSPRRRAEAPEPEVSAELLGRPRLAPRVTVHEPLEEGSPWIVQSGQQYIRVGADLARLLLVMDGVRDHAGLAGALGAPWTARDVTAAVERLRTSGLLDDGKRRRRRLGGDFFKYVPPMTFQFTLLRPQRLLGVLAPVIRMLANPFCAVLGALIALGGVLALTLQTPTLERALGQPMPMAILFGLVGASALATVLHELGHGAVLTYYGGRPSRMGFMLFYMSPAFFCDVSDGWRLPHKEQRTRIALAGIVTQLIIAGTVAVASLVHGSTSGPSTFHDGMVVFALSTYLAGLLNLVPFVKLDGYLALMSHLDVSHLRDRAMTDARRFVARLLFGGRHQRELPQFSWAVPFGLVCMVFPLYLVGVAAALWSDLLQGLGALGGALVVAAVAFLLHRAFTGARRLVGEAVRGGARRGRIIGAGLLVVCAVAGTLTFVRLPYTVVGGFVADGDRLSLVLAESSDLQAVREGSTVRLQRRGVVIRTDVGTATVASARPETATAPFSAFLPIREVDDLPMPVSSFPLDAGRPPSDRVGMATVRVGDRPLGQWVYLTYVAPALR